MTKNPENENNQENRRNIFINRYDKSNFSTLSKTLHFAIIYIFEGHCTQNIGLNRLNLQKGDIIILPPNINFTFELADDETVIFAIMLKYKNFYEIFAPFIEGSHAINKLFAAGLYEKNPIKYLIFHTGDDEAIRENVLTMFNDQFNNDEYIDQLLIGRLLTGFVYMMRHYRNNFEAAIKERSNLPDDFEIMKYIQDNLTTVTLANIAEHFNFSVSHCSRLIKKATGHGFNEWKKVLRMRKAQSLLTNTTYSIIEIANAIGYANPENFIRTFQKEFKLTPTQYRKQAAAYKR